MCIVSDETGGYLAGNESSSDRNVPAGLSPGPIQRPANKGLKN